MSSQLSLVIRCNSLCFQLGCHLKPPLFDPPSSGTMALASLYQLPVSLEAVREKAGCGMYTSGPQKPPAGRRKPRAVPFRLLVLLCAKPVILKVSKPKGRQLVLGPGWICRPFSFPGAWRLFGGLVRDTHGNG